MTLMPIEKAKTVDVPLGMVKNFQGMPISIDLSKISYFGLGPNHFPTLWLSPDNWYDTVPEGLDDEQANILARAIASGEVVVGKRWIPPIRKDKHVLDKYINHLRSARVVDDKFKKPIQQLFLSKKEGNYTAVEIFRKLLVDEQNRTNRDNFIAYLKEAIANYSGPELLVQDFPSDPQNYTVQLDPNTFEVLSDTRKRQLEETPGLAVPAEHMSEFKGLDNPEHRAAKLNDLI
jgi:hypothetical protein